MIIHKNTRSLIACQKKIYKKLFDKINPKFNSNFTINFLNLIMTHLLYLFNINSR